MSGPWPWTIPKPPSALACRASPRLGGGAVASAAAPAQHRWKPPAMRYRPLGRTGQFVSEICLGTMTFHGGAGFWRNVGTLDQQGATGAGRARARGRRQFHRHRRRLFRRAVRGPARAGAARPQGRARGRDRRHQGARPHRPGPERRRPVARPHHGSDRRQPEAAEARPCRSLSDPRLRSRDAAGGDHARARRLRLARLSCAPSAAPTWRPGRS